MIAQRVKRVAGDPSASDPALRVDTFVDSTKFQLEAMRGTGQAERIRQGRNEAGFGLRVWYQPRRAKLENGDRLKVDGVTYSILYIQTLADPYEVCYIDLERL